MCILMSFFHIFPLNFNVTILLLVRNLESLSLGFTVDDLGEIYRIKTIIGLFKGAKGVTCMEFKRLKNNK